MSERFSAVVLLREDGLLSARLRCQRCGELLDCSRAVNLAWVATEDPADVGALSEPAVFCELCWTAEPVKATWPNAQAALEVLLRRWLPWVAA